MTYRTSTNSEATAPPRKLAVVGGGMLGMTLALRLAQRGHQVTLLEAAPTLGGLTSALRMGEVVWDRYYHVTLLSDTHLLAVLDELGLRRQMKWVETRTGFYTGGKLYSMSNSREFLGFPPLTLVEKIRLGLTIFYASKIRDWRRLEKVPVTEWLRKWSGDGTFEKIWLPLLRAKMGEAYRSISAAFIWAHINRMYKARRTGLKKEMFGYVPGGYARIIDRLAEVLAEHGVTIRCSAAVTEAISQAEGGVRLTTASGGSFRFDDVVFTVPSHFIANACPQLTPDEKRRFLGVDYLGIVCASLLLKKPISPYYVTNITDSWVPLTAVIEISNIVNPAELGGHSLVYLPKYVPPDDPTYDLPDDQFEERCLSTLQRMYPHFSRDDVAAFRVSRTRNVMALPTLDYSQRLPPMKTSVPGIYAINSAHIVKGNLNVNETIEIAESALRQVLDPALACIGGPIGATVPSESHCHATSSGELVARP